MGALVDVLFNIGVGFVFDVLGLNRLIPIPNPNQVLPWYIQLFSMEEVRLIISHPGPKVKLIFFHATIKPSEGVKAGLWVPVITEPFVEVLSSNTEDRERPNTKP